MIDRRFAAAIVVLLGCALIPTVIHSYRGLTVDDGLRVEAIATVLDGMPSRPTGRKAGWAEGTLATHDWIERYYRVGQEEVSLFVGRSFDPKRLYHHPELALLKGTDTRPAGRASLPGRPDVPIHLLTTSRSGKRGVAAYALRYEDHFVERPILFQVRIAAQQLLSGRRAMTLFLAADRSGLPEDLSHAPAVVVLAAAIAAFDAQITPTAK